ncbi:transposase [Glycomyces harbinensis]|uniref:transposase n=1 Tax=Glycomyces harbinensis TaxID=58114 RepID=UPI000B82CC9F|nr:transposase [Glycomyces harbinensis]
MAGVITAKDESLVLLFSGLSPSRFARLVRQLRREGADPVLRGRPWKLAFEDRVLLVAAYWRTNLTMRQIAALFGTSKSAADRIIDDLAPKLALRPRQRYAPETVLIVDGTLVPTRDHAVAAKSKNYRYSTNHQVVIHADTRRAVVVGEPLPGNRNDSVAFAASGVDHATHTATIIADGGYQGTRAVIPHRRRAKDEPLTDWKEAHNASHRKVRARIEHTFAKMKVWKVLRDCRLRGNGSAEAMAGIARLYNLTLED